MSQSTATKLVSKLRFNVHPRRKFRNPEGPVGRHNRIKKIVTALFKHERIEVNFTSADESRGYAERLISEAIRNGDCHKPTMEMACYWITEPTIVHKLFKVLAPRYKEFDQSYTKLWKAPKVYPGTNLPKSILELRKNIYPPLEPDKTHRKNLIHNVLLEEARKAYLAEKAKKEAAAGSEIPKETSATEVNQSDVNQNLQTEGAVEGSATSEKISMAEDDSELPRKDLDSADVSKSELKGETNSASETDLDVSKLKITEEKLETSREHKKE